MSRLKIDFETEDTNVVCELADMLRRLHGREGHECGRQPVGSHYNRVTVDDVETPDTDAPEYHEPTKEEILTDLSSPFGQSMPVTAEELGFTNGVLPPNPFVAGVQLGNDLLPPPTMPPAGVELDADGLPWDARIHSSSKGKLAKTGTWKLARNLDPALAASVTAELKAAMALPAARAVPGPTHPDIADTDAEQSAGAYLPPVMPPTPPAPHLSVVPPPPVPQPTAVTPPPTALGAMTFPAFLVEITKQQAAKRLTFDEVMAVLKEHGLENLQLLTARPDLIPSVYSRLEAVWTSR